MPNDNASRREVLKKAGMTAGALSVVGTGNAAAAPDVHVQVNVQPLESWNNDNTWDCRQALDHALTQLSDELSQVNFSYDLIHIRRAANDEYSDVDYSSTQCDIVDDDMSEAVANDTAAGIHVLTTNNSNFANLPYEYMSAWGSDPAIIWVGTAGDYGGQVEDDTERYKNATVQETGHALIDHSEIDGGYGHGEHQLGMITEQGESTPLLTFYEEGDSSYPCDGGEDLSGEGPCSTGTDWDGTHRRDMTSCSVDTIDATLSKHSSDF